MTTGSQASQYAEHYSQEFYANQIPDSIKSAEVVLGVLFEMYKPQSMLDIGCGAGTWLSVAQRLGVLSLHGFDGPWVRSSALLSKDIVFSAVNMEDSIPITRRFDLAMSVEVAEHLSSVRAKGIVDALCQASDVVLFGAAVIGQGGENHVNEQRQSYWVGHFSERDYECFDAIRPSVWNSANVAPWYRQNTLLYINRQRADLLELFSNAQHPQIINIIHPEMFERRVQSYKENLKSPSLRFTLSVLKTYLLNQLGLSR